jgi:hypothetical protein
MEEVSQAAEQIRRLPRRRTPDLAADKLMRR